MKKQIAFTLILIIGFATEAQTSIFDNIEDSITIRPTLTLVDFNDKSFAVSDNLIFFNTYSYLQKITKQKHEFHMVSSAPEVMREDFVVFSHKQLKNNFFNDYNITYRRDQLKRLLPNSLDPTYYNPCVAGD